MGTFSHSSNSDDSDASDSSDEGRSRFRVSVCLRRYFSDERARAFVLVRARRRVRWLHRRLARLFGVRGACLRAAGHLLPRAESLRVLRPADTVEVIPLQEAQSEYQSKRDATTQTAAEAAQPAVKTITSTRFCADIAVCNGTTFHRDNCESRVKNNSHYKDRDTEMLMEDSTENVTELPATTAANTTVDHHTVDSTRDQDGDNLQGAATDVNSSEEGSLLTLKRRALALLEAQCAAADESPPSRRRRRVRRRAKRAATPPPPDAPRAAAARPAATPPPPVALPAATPPPPDAPRTADARPAAMPPPPSAPGDVARNEDACARKPRVVHSLDLEDMSFN